MADNETALLRWLHAEAAYERDVALANYEPALAHKDRIIQRIADERDRERTSRQAWAEEAMRLDVELVEAREEVRRRHRSMRLGLIVPTEGLGAILAGDPLSATPWAEGGEPE